MLRELLVDHPRRRQYDDTIVPHCVARLDGVRPQLLNSYTLNGRIFEDGSEISRVAHAWGAESENKLCMAQT